MLARKREAILSLAVFALVEACTPQGRDASTGAPPLTSIAPSIAAASAPVPSPPPSSAPPSPSATFATAPAPTSSEAKSPAPLVRAVRRPRSRPESERECKTCNGVWGIHGLAQTPSCNCRTSDGGKRCRDGTECEALCVAPESPEREVTQAGTPARGYWVGKCSEFVTVFGCYRPIHDGAGTKPVELGEPLPMICVD